MISSKSLNRFQSKDTLFKVNL